jgi:lipopolysaccharide export system permease protein
VLVRHHLKHYVFMNFNQVFFPLFLTLYVIASVILFVKISGITSIVQIDFYELFQLYFYSLPSVFFFTLPISFFAGSVIAIRKMCYDYEMSVLFSLGMSPSSLIQLFFGMSSLLSLMLLVLSLNMIPLSKQLYKSFLETKKNSANINIRASEFGQKFGDWMIFINKSSQNNNQFEDVVLFSPVSLQKESFIMAQDVKVIGDTGGSRLQLSQGKVLLEQHNTFEQINFKTLTIRDMSDNISSAFSGILDYWKQAFEGNSKRAKDFCSSILVSLLPLLSVFLIFVLGIHHPRYQRNFSYLYIIAICFLFYGLTYAVSISMPFIGILFVPVVWLIVTYGIYRYAIARVY